MVGVGDGLVPCPAPVMITHQLALPADRDPFEVGGHVDQAADHGRVDGVVVARDPHVVVAGQPDPTVPPQIHWRGRQGEHRRAVGCPPGRRRTLDPTRVPAVRGLQPSLELAVEVSGSLEVSAGQERGFEVAVVPLGQALRLGVPGLAQVEPGTQTASERLERWCQGRFAASPTATAPSLSHTNSRGQAPICSTVSSGRRSGPEPAWNTPSSPNASVSSRR